MKLLKYSYLRPEFILGILLVILSIILLYGRLKLGLIRYFDADEFVHLHWGYNFFSGLRPYKDYLYFFPPGYLFFLWPVFVLAGKSILVLSYARVLAFATFLFLCLILFFIAKMIRNKFVAILSVFFLIFLPLPADKMLEVRPDTLATGFFLLGLYFFLRFINAQAEVKTDKINIFLAGFFSAISLLIVPKAIFSLTALLCAFLILFIRNKIEVKYFRKLLFGLLLPLLSCLAYFVYSGTFTKAINLTITFASHASQVLGHKFYISPAQFFNPMEIFYGEKGFSFTFILSLIMYVVSIAWGIGRFLTAFSIKNIFKGAGDFAVAALFLANLFAFIKIYPLKHSQYLIALAPWVAFYFADFLYALKNKLPDKWHLIYYSGLGLFIISVFYRVTLSNNFKSTLNNLEDKKKLNFFLQNIKSGEYVFDMYGASIFYKDPFYICCIPYGQYLESFNFPLPSLEKALLNTQTKYLVIASNNNYGALPPLEWEFLVSRYVQEPKNPAIFVSGVNLNFEKTSQLSFELVARGDYEVILPKSNYSDDPNLLQIDGKRFDNKVIWLEAGKHEAYYQKKEEVTIKLVYPQIPSINYDK